MVNKIKHKNNVDCSKITIFFSDLGTISPLEKLAWIVDTFRLFGRSLF